MAYKMRPLAAAIILSSTALGLVLACGTAAATDYPLTLENCGVEITLEAAPQRVVTVGQAGTEALYELGLGDRLIGTSVWFTDVPEPFRELNATVPRLADNDPSFESVVATKPDLVIIQFEWHVGPEGIVGTRDQFHELGIPTYQLPADCVGNDNSTGVDGTGTELFSVATLVRGVEEMGRIFDIEAEAADFAQDLVSREASASARAKALNIEDVSAVFWFSSADIAVDPYVAGRLGAPGYMMETLGIRNVVHSDEEWPVAGWETIVQANPDIIVVAEMNRRRFPADGVEAKLEFLRTDPVASQMDAVKNDRIVIMDAHAMDRTLRTVEGIEVLADALETFELAQ
jgi:iron complex transport system substrate-binding protein